MDTQVLVIGAGPAGLAVAACLRRRGIEPLVVDRDSAVGDSWRVRYDRLRLHTPRVQSALPGMRIPRRFGRWVARDDMAQYLQAYAEHHGIRPRFQTMVKRLEPDGDLWTVNTGAERLLVRHVVLATGGTCEPWMPNWPGLDSFPGDVLHANLYRHPDRFRRRAVLVVGAGNSGAEIAADLAEGGARVWLAVRTPPHVIPRTVGPLPTTLLGVVQDRAPAGLVDPANRWVERRFIGDLTAFGMPAPSAGLIAQARATGTVPTIDVGLVEQLRAGRVTPVAAVQAFDGEQAILADGIRLKPDVVIAATGYRTGLRPLVGHLGVLDGDGHPFVHGGTCAPSAPGLRFVGLVNSLKGLLLQINVDARAAARAIDRDLAAIDPRR